MLAIFNYFIIQIILFYESNNMNIDLIMKTLYVIMIAYLSFHGISSTYSKVCAEKDNSFILKFRKQNKILVCKYFSEIFLKNIYISSMLYISINIAIFILLNRDFKSIAFHFVYYIIYILFPIAYKYIIISLIHLYKNKFNLSYMFKFLLKNSLVFLASYFLANIIINTDIKHNIFRHLDRVILFIGFFLFINMFILIGLILVFRNKVSTETAEKKQVLLQFIINKIKNKIIYYQFIILKREKDTLETLFSGIFYVSLIILGVSLNLNREMLTQKMNMIVFFSLISSFELSHLLLTRILSIENDRTIIRHLINNNCIINYFKSKIVIYFIAFIATNIFIILPIMGFGEIVDFIALIIIISIYSLIYSLNSVLGNIVKPNFSLLKNEELRSTLNNDIIDAFLKMIHIIIYYSLGILLFSNNYLNKISNITLWVILIIVMLLHLCTIFLLYRIILSKKIWTNWEGV